MSLSDKDIIITHNKSIKYPLTEEEINNLLDFIKPLKGLPPDSAESVVDRQRENFARQLRDIPINRKILPKLKNKLELSYIRSLIEPGKSVGALASTSIGERNTQNSLSSFHTAGQQKINLLVGVPRLQEIVNVSRDIKTPSMEIWLNYSPDKLSDLSFVRSRSLEILEYREIIDFVIDWETIENRKIKSSDESWYNLHRSFIGTDYEACEWSVRLIFNPEILYARKLQLSIVAQVIHDNWADAFCVISPDNIGIIDVYIKTDNIGEINDIIESIKSSRRKGKKKREVEDDADITMLITDENKEKYFIRDLVIPSILYLPVGGIEGIKRCFFQEKGGQWYITTIGSNLRAVINHPEIDPYRTITNHLWDTFECLGIEATRSFLRRELDKLISVDHRHIDLLINSITYSGKPMPASNRGIDIRQVGLLAKIGFEQPWHHFFKAALTTERDDMSGASSAIIAGRIPNLGGGIPKLLDQNKWQHWKDCKLPTVAETDLEIDEDKETYNYSESMNLNRSTSVRAPIRLPIKNKPENESQEVKLIRRNVPVKKSNINKFIEPRPFVPTIPTRNLDYLPESLTTRLSFKPNLAKDRVSRDELKRMDPINNKLFHNALGNVKEHDNDSNVY